MSVKIFTAGPSASVYMKPICALFAIVSLAYLCSVRSSFVAPHVLHPTPIPAAGESAEVRFDHWLTHFKAADPKYQDYCMNILKTRTGSSSQFEQDVFLFFNLFWDWPMKGRKGFYVDSGANDAENLSNTFFFDKCLGWDGLCVEPQSMYHADILAKRSCKLVPKCISDKVKSVMIEGTGAGANVEEGAGPSSVECESLHDMLKAVGRDSVDLWSLDVEGHEMTVLDSVQFNRLHVNVLLIEDFWISARDLQALMTAKGYVLFQELAVDAVLAKRSFPIPENVWYPVNFDKNNKLNQEYRMVMKDKLVA